MIMPKIKQKKPDRRAAEMAGKIEQAIDYIAQLDPGDKVSVRSLAQALGMSEGTAYKSIKAAEAQGLVSAPSASTCATPNSFTA